MSLIRLYRRVMSLLAPESRATVCLSLANLAVAGIGFLDPILFGRVIDLLTRSADIPIRTLWQEAVPLLTLWVGVGIGGIGAGMTVALLADRMAHRTKMREMARLYSHVLALPAHFHGENHSGGLMRILLAGSDNLFWAWLGLFRDQFVSFVSILILLPLTLFLNWRLSLSLIVLMVLFGALTATVISRTDGKQRTTEKYHKALASTAHDALSNVVVVQAFTRLAAERRMFSDLGQQVMAHQFPILTWWALVSILTRSASTLAIMTIVILGTVLHVRGQASVGEIVSFMGFASLLIGRLEGLVWFVAKLFSSAPILREYFAVLDTRSAVPEATDATPLPAHAAEVAFDDVSFSYPSGAPVLSGVTFVAKPGQVIALVGQTGAGKSTTMSLLQRMWDPSSGSISIGGHDIRHVTLDSLRGSIGVVFQDSMLFARSIRENLLVGRPEATQEEIETACRLAQAHDFIMRQPQGYDTAVGERGTTLSGGQKQRIAIARALLKNPPILILDEATSALDAATEAKVGQALKALMAGRTTFIIAHRLSTIRDADEILFFEGGNIAERGNFETLVRQGGRFADLVATQIIPAVVSAAPGDLSRAEENAA